MVSQRLAVVTHHNRKMRHRPFFDRHYADRWRCSRRVTIDHLAPPGICSLETGKQDPESRRLHLVHARVAASRLDNLILAPPAILPERTDPVCQLRVRRENRTAVAQGAEILGRIETEGRDVAKAPDHRARDARTMSLRAIFQDRDVATARAIYNGPEPGHVDRPAIEVRRND